MGSPPLRMATVRRLRTPTHWCCRRRMPGAAARSACASSTTPRRPSIKILYISCATCYRSRPAPVDLLSRASNPVLSRHMIAAVKIGSCHVTAYCSVFSALATLAAASPRLSAHCTRLMFSGTEVRKAEIKPTDDCPYIFSLNCRSNPNHFILHSMSTSEMRTESEQGGRPCSTCGTAALTARDRSQVNTRAARSQ